MPQPAFQPCRPRQVQRPSAVELQHLPRGALSQTGLAQHVACVVGRMRRHGLECGCADGLEGMYG